MPDFRKLWHDFLHPRYNRAFFIRVLVLAVLAFVFFRFVCRPMVLDGQSMYPNYHSGTLNFCWVPTFWFRAPARGDVVALRYAGDRVLLLKRIIGLPGETLSIEKGIVRINGKALDEPYVRKGRLEWNLPPRRIDPGYIYVIGDNRSMPMEQHKFGEISADRLEGTLLL